MKRYLKWIGQILTVLSLVFIVYAVWKLGLDFSNIENVPAFVLVLLIGVAGKTFTVFISSYVWSGWVFFFAGRKGNRKEAIRVYTKANTGKYLPGNVMHYIERNLFADKMGVGQAKIAASSVIEVISFVLVAFTTAFFFSYKQLILAIHTVVSAVGNYMILIGIIAAICLIAGCIIVVIIFRKKVLDVIKDYKMSEFIVRLVFSMFGQAAVLSILGLIFVLLYVYMGGTVSGTDVTAIVAGYIISWVLGFVVPGAPGGIGIRELVLTLLVGAIVGQELVLTIALIHRLITIIGDFLAYLIGSIFCRGKEECR